MTSTQWPIRQQPRTTNTKPCNTMKHLQRLTQQRLPAWSVKTPSSRRSLPINNQRQKMANLKLKVKSLLVVHPNPIKRPNLVVRLNSIKKLNSLRKKQKINKSLIKSNQGHQHLPRSQHENKPKKLSHSKLNNSFPNSFLPQVNQSRNQT